jgi:hypothetical protein
VDYATVDLNLATDLAALPKHTEILDGSWTGRLFKVSGTVVTDGELKIRVHGKVFDLYAPQRDVRDLLLAQSISGKTINFYGELGTYRGNWQFVIKDATWMR